MKHLANGVVLWALFTAACGTATPPDPTADRQAIAAASAKFTAGENTSSIEQMRACFADDIVVMGPSTKPSVTGIESLVAATVAAIRMGAIDLAVGNIFGSNAFNMCVLFAMDIAYTGGPLLAAADPTHAVSAVAAILVIALGMMGILARAQRRIDAARVESLLIVVVYAGLLWLLVA